MSWERSSASQVTAGPATRDRWTLRAGFEGIHAGNGEGGLHILAPQAEESFHRRHPRRCDARSFPVGRRLDPRRRDEGALLGLGADGTVGANKNSIKIIGDETDLLVQAYFVYDSKKSGSMTMSHLRIEPRADSLAVSHHASFVACHQFHFLDRFDVVGTPRTVRVSAERAGAGDRGVGSVAAGVEQHIVDKRLTRATRSTRRRWPGRTAWPAHQHRLADVLFRPSRECCRKTKRSRKSSRPSRKPTARGVRGRQEEHRRRG